MKVYGVGIHRYTLTASIPGEEEKSTATVEVEPTNGTKLEQVSAECSDIHFDFINGAYRATLIFKVYLYNPREKEVKVRDITVLQNYSLGDLERFFNIPLANVSTGSLSVGKWSISPESFSLASHGTETVTFSLPMEISSWIPVSVSDATEVVLKDGEYTKVSFTYTLGYTYDGNDWKQFEGHVSDYVPVTMDAKTVAADYILSGAMAYVSAWTLLKVPSEFKVKVKGVEFNPVGVFLGVAFYYGKGKILETLANWWG